MQGLQTFHTTVLPDWEVLGFPDEASLLDVMRCSNEHAPTNVHTIKRIAPRFVEYRGSRALYFRGDDGQACRMAVGSLDDDLDAVELARFNEAFSGYRVSDVCTSSVRAYLAKKLGETKNRAKTRGYAFDLDIEWLQQMYNGQRGRCALSGVRFDVSDYRSVDRWRKPFRPSLDRKLPEDGYVKGNVRLVLTAVNNAMGAWGQYAFTFIAASHIRHLKGG